jgi:TM2 domain-containing membrane protein YozV
MTHIIDEGPTPERTKPRNAFIAFLFSLLLPGLGQIYNGQPFKAALFFFLPCKRMNHLISTTYNSRLLIALLTLLAQPVFSQYQFGESTNYLTQSRQVTFDKMTTLYTSGNLQIPTDPSKKWNYFADLSTGFIPESVGFRGNSSASAGVTYLSRYGLGVSYSGVFNGTRRASGLGLEFRLPVDRWLLFKLQAGAVLRASDYDESGPTIITYQPDASQPYYWRGLVAVRFARVFFAGVSTMHTGNLSFRYENGFPPNPTGTYSTSVRSTMWQIGISLPALKKRER